MRVNVDYAALCMGTGLASSVQDMEAVRRINELYVGDGGRMAFNNRSTIEKRAVKALPLTTPVAGATPLQGGTIALKPVTLDKGYRWMDRGGDWIDYNTAGQIVAYGDRNDNTVWLQRDTNGVVHGVIDDTGQVLYTLHYADGRLIEIRDYPRADNNLDLPARSVKYHYDQFNRLVAVTDVRGYDTRYEYDTNHKLTAIVDAEGRREVLEYSGQSIKKRTAPDGGVTDYVFEYDEVNKQFISKIKGPETESGRRTEDHTHNRVGKLVRQIVNGRTDLEVKYDTGARAEARTNARGFTTVITRNEFDQITQIARADGSVVKRMFDARHLQIAEETDEAGFKTTYEYDTKGSRVRQTEAVGAPEARVTEYAVNEQGRPARVTLRGRTEANGSVTADAVWQVEYDERGQVRQLIDPEGAIRRYRFDRLGNLSEDVDPRGNTWRYESDAAGNLLKVTDALGRARTYSHDKVGNVTSYTDARGKATLMVYDAMNRETQYTSPAGGSYRVQYNGHGMPVVETDEDGRNWKTEYDNFLRVSREVDALGNATEHRYNLSDGSQAGLLGSLGEPTELQYPTFKMQRRYDERERPTQSVLLNPTTTGTEGLLESTTFDKRGFVKTMTDANGKTRFLTFDALGRVTRYTNSLGKNIDLVWDARDNLIEFKDFNGNTTRFEYDRMDRLVSEKLPLGQVKTYAYDAKGNTESITYAGGNKIRYTYDANDQRTRIDVTAVGAMAPELSYTFTYEAEGNLASWSDGTRSATFTYDENGRLLSETTSYGNNLSLTYAYTYTQAGYKKSLQYPDGTLIGYTHDLQGELSSVEIPGEGSISVNEWNWLVPKKATLPGGTTQEFSHDGLLKLTGLKVKNPGQQVVLDLANQFGKLQEIAQKSITDSSSGASSTVTTQYSYDTERQLTQAVRDTGGVFGVSTETFGLDAAGNRITHSAVSGAWRYDANNRLIQRGDTGYAYDDNGNLLRRTAGTSGSPASITEFIYDALNRLAEVRDGAGTLVARYTYDPFDNRLTKDVYRDSLGSVLATARRTHYLYADEGLIAEADASGAVTTQYGFKPDSEWGSGPIFIKTQVGDAGNAQLGYAYFHNDHLGTPIRATDKAGKVVWRADYNSFGAALPAAENQLNNPLRFAGQYLDPETGLHYNTRRYYDPVTGRYVTADPLGLSGGQNLYTYAGANPANLTDPTGEHPIIAGIILAIEIYVIVDKWISWAEWAIDTAEHFADGTTECIGLPPVLPRIPKLPKLPKGKKPPKDPPGCPCGVCPTKNSFPAETVVHVKPLEDTHDSLHQTPTVLKSISELKPGDEVLSLAEWKEKGPDAKVDSRLSYERITDVFTSARAQTLVHLRLDNGELITATEGHPFKTDEGWRDAVLLKRGGKLVTIPDGEGSEGAVTIADVRVETKTVRVFNLEVANAHTFFVGTEGILVHNYIPPPKGPLPGFPGSRPIGNRGGRASWDLGGGRRGSWDSQHGEVEVYGRDGRHQGAYDPNSGQRIKPPVKKRRCPPGLF